MSTVDEAESSKVKLSKGQKKKKSAQKKKAAQKTAVEEEQRQVLDDAERKLDNEDAVLLDRFCDHTLKTNDNPGPCNNDKTNNSKSSFLLRVTNTRLDMLRASYRSRIRMARLVTIEFGAVQNPLWMGTACKYYPPLKEDELEKDTGPTVLKDALTTDELDREHINTKWAYTRESFCVALSIWYPIFVECFHRGDKLSCAALRDTSVQLRACWLVFRGDITRLDQFVFDARNPTCIKQLNWVARRIELPVSPPSSPPSPDAAQQLGPETSQKSTSQRPLPTEQSQEDASIQEADPSSAVSSHITLLEDVDSIFTSPLDHGDSLPQTPANDPGSFGDYQSTRRWADYSDDESIGSPMSIPARKIPGHIDVRVEDLEDVDEGNSLRMSEMERQDGDQDVDRFQLDESSAGHDLPLRPHYSPQPQKTSTEGISTIKPDNSEPSCTLQSHLDDQHSESHREPQSIPPKGASSPSHRVVKLLIAQPTLALVTYTKAEDKTVLASTQFNVMAWEEYPPPKISTVERSMKLVSSTQKSFMIPVVNYHNQDSASSCTVGDDISSKSESHLEPHSQSTQALSSKKSKKKKKTATSNEPRKRKVEGQVESWLRYDKEKQSTNRRRTLKPNSNSTTSLLFSEPLQTLEESRQVEDNMDAWNERMALHYTQKFSTYIGSVDLLVGGIRVSEVAKMVFGGRFRASKNALAPPLTNSPVSCFQKGVGLGLGMDLGMGLGLGFDQVQGGDGNAEEEEEDKKVWSRHWSLDEDRVKVVLVEIQGEDTWWPRYIKEFTAP